MQAGNMPAAQPAMPTWTASQQPWTGPILAGGGAQQSWNAQSPTGTWPGQVPAYQPPSAPSFQDFAAQIEKSVKAEVVKAAEMEFDRIQQAHTAEMQRLQQALQEKQQEVDAAKSEAANHASQQHGNDGWQTVQQHAPVQKEERVTGKRSKHGKICFSCYQQESYHGQGNCSHSACPLNGGPSPYQGLDAMKQSFDIELNKLFANMKIMQTVIDDQGHEMTVLSNRIQELEVHFAKLN